MHVESFIYELSQYLKFHPRKEGQSREERALEVLSHIIGEMDDSFDAARKFREQYAKNNPGSYYFLRVKDNTQIEVKVTDLPLFSKHTSIPEKTLYAIGNGEVRECKGYVRSTHYPALGSPFKPTLSADTIAHLQHYEKQGKQAKEGIERQARAKRDAHMREQPLTTTTFNPTKGL